MLSISYSCGEHFHNTTRVEENGEKVSIKIDMRPPLEIVPKLQKEDENYCYMYDKVNRYVSRLERNLL